MAPIGWTESSNPRRVALILAIGLLVACIANGAYGYLARLGVLDQALFREHVQLYCDIPETSRAPLALACRCMQIRPDIDYSVAPWPDYLYQTGGYRFALKLGKDLLVALLLLASLAWLPKLRAGASQSRDIVPALGFAAVLAIGVAISMAAQGPMIAALGLRSFEFFAVAALAAFLSPHLAGFARALMLLLAIEAVLVAVEMLFGMPMRTCPNSFRAAGTLVLPNSLGIAIGLCMAFVAAFHPTSLQRAWPWLAAAWLEFASGSGGGIVLLFLVAVVTLMRRVAPQRRWRWLGAAVLGALALAALLPVLTQRPQVYDSLFGLDGRVDKAMQVWQTATPMQRLFGHGIGVGTNSAVNLAQAPLAPVRAAYADEVPFYADSTITAFQMQFGLAGTLAWLLLLAWGWTRDAVARPFYLTVAAASLIINIPELFPANLLLGLALAHSFVHARLVEAAPT